MEKLRSFLIFFFPFLLFFFYFTYQSGEQHFSANSSHTDHGFVEIPEGYDVPSVKIFVTQDQSDTWLLEVQTERFKFNPKMVGANLPSYNEGHAHLYINGEKVNRIYGRYYNLGTLKLGKNEIKVTLNSNNHGILTHNGKLIENSTVVDVSY
ncbi:hypothetical protein EKG37_07025 [Robertmurraya yapensis]|uniref:Uncharacterized protein n=2 Tax=Bacillaceae TaxID=186817 RepID=A0A431WF65_9BACI|nr:hypothetical protein [Bacillus yapensis]RTR33958.1 hypothetical protein EKG37_07025 [Bacillus yapensis]TKS97276.1 hypothetical protein FAR12_07025 [Bacillus yapensis]